MARVVSGRYLPSALTNVNARTSSFGIISKSSLTAFTTMRLNCIDHTYTDTHTPNPSLRVDIKARTTNSHTDLVAGVLLAELERQRQLSKSMHERDILVLIFIGRNGVVTGWLAGAASIHLNQGARTPVTFSPHSLQSINSRSRASPLTATN